MRRPEIDGFISVAAPASEYDFTFLAPCPASGLIVHGSDDRIVPPDDMERVMSKVRAQKGIEIRRQIEAGAGHMFTNHMDKLEQRLEDYLDERLPIVFNERRTD